MGSGALIKKRGTAGLEKIETSASAAAMMMQENALGSKKGTPIADVSQNGENGKGVKI